MQQSQHVLLISGSVYSKSLSMLYQLASVKQVELVHVAADDFMGNEVKRGESTCNKLEAERLCDYLEKLFSECAEAAYDLDIGILTPYAAQKSLLYNMLFDRGLLREKVRVDTIDGFQGLSGMLDTEFRQI